MQRIDIIAVGHLKEKYLKDAESEYSKRLSSLCSFKVTEIEPERLPDAPKPAEISSALEKEADRIISALPQHSFCVPLCIEGDMADSVALSKKLSDLAVGGESRICFIIGGSYGLSERIKNFGSWRLSMSRMTFPHQLARIMLEEQIYRAFKISAGGTYHK